MMTLETLLNVPGRRTTGRKENKKRRTTRRSRNILAIGRSLPRKGKKPEANSGEHRSLRS
jgi:hypothetical protein